MELINKEAKLYILHESEYKDVFVLCSDSPESRLAYMDYSELDFLNSVGINCITLTIFNGDPVADVDRVVPESRRGDRWAIHPFKDRRNPHLGYDAEWIASVKQYFSYWISLRSRYNSDPKLIRVLLLENEFWRDREIKGDLLVKYVRDMVTTFKEFPIIWDFEEIDTSSEEIQLLYRTVKEAGGYTAIHNPLHRRDIWKEAVPYLDMISYQRTQEELSQAITTNFQNNFSVTHHASEITPVSNYFRPDDFTKAERWIQSSPRISAASFFIQYDQAHPDTFQYNYGAFFKNLTNHTSDDLNSYLTNNPQFALRSTYLSRHAKYEYTKGKIKLSRDKNAHKTDSVLFSILETRYILDVGSGPLSLVMEVEKSPEFKAEFRARVFSEDFEESYMTLYPVIADREDKDTIFLTIKFDASAEKRYKVALDVYEVGSEVPNNTFFRIHSVNWSK